MDGRVKVGGMDVEGSRHVPRRGMASDTCGRVSVTMLWKTVSESRMVTPETEKRRSLRTSENECRPIRLQ